MTVLAPGSLAKGNGAGGGAISALSPFAGGAGSDCTLSPVVDLMMPLLLLPLPLTAGGAFAALSPVSIDGASSIGGGDSLGTINRKALSLASAKGKQRDSVGKWTSLSGIDLICVRYC